MTDGSSTSKIAGNSHPIDVLGVGFRGEVGRIGRAVSCSDGVAARKLHKPEGPRRPGRKPPEHAPTGAEEHHHAEAQCRPFIIR